MFENKLQGFKLVVYTTINDWLKKNRAFHFHFLIDLAVKKTGHFTMAKKFKDYTTLCCQKLEAQWKKLKCFLNFP